jgi:low temperature requirement protein LtrA
MPTAPATLRRPIDHLHRRLLAMTGRDPNEAHRTATPLELFFDLVFVIAFAQASTEFAHLLAEGYYADAIAGFAFTMFGVIWAWINFTWFASAFDRDDWAYRVVTMVQMLGVMILALGIHDVFTSIHEGGTFHNGEVVLGYVVMRLAMVFQWLRVARQDPSHREGARTFALMVTIAQVMWVGLYFLHLEFVPLVLLAIPAYLVELMGPILAERKNATPWHPHHIAERHSLLAIIALGEGLTGTFMAFHTMQEELGWTWEVAAVGFAGVALTFGMWWTYFMVPSGEVLHLRRHKAFPWGYSHILLFASITATGAGLHVAAYYIEHVAHIGILATVLTVAIPVAIFTGSVYVLYTYLVEQIDRYHFLLVALTAAVLLLAVGLAAMHVPVAICLLVLMLAPAVTVVGYELLGHEHRDQALAAVHARVHRHVANPVAGETGSHS